MVGEHRAPRLYDCCEHCEHGINDPPHNGPCPEGCAEAEDDSRPWSSGPSLVELDAYGDFAPERRGQ